MTSTSTVAPTLTWPTGSGKGSNAMPPRSPRPADEPDQLVYGYIRAETPDETKISLLRKNIGDYCRHRGYRLATICCDRGSDGSELARPGFTAALDALALATSHALLVPDLDHLSPDQLVREGLTRMVRRTGAQLITVDSDGTQTSGQDTHW